MLLEDIDKATTWWVVQKIFKLYVGETLTEKSDLFGLRTCRCGVWIVISAYVGKHNYLLSWTTDAWLRQPEIGIRQYFKSKQFLQALRVSIAETHSTFTISLKGLPDGCGNCWVSFFHLVITFWRILIDLELHCDLDNKKNCDFWKQEYRDNLRLHDNLIIG